MKLLFDRLHHWLARHAPAVLADLRHPASEESLHAAETAMSLSFPADIRAAYRIHDGQDTDSYGNFRPFLYGREWLRLERMVEEWNLGKRLYDEDQRYPFWRAHWIPLAFDGAQLLHYDTQTEQVIEAWEGDFHFAGSFEWLLEELIEELEFGRDYWVRETPLQINDVIQERFLGGENS